MSPEAIAAGYGKLARLRHAVAVHAERRQAAPPPLPVPGLLEREVGGEWLDTADGRVFVRDEWYPLDHLHGPLPLAAPLTIPAEVLALLARGDAPAAHRLAFFDIETTGLSGGAGTYVILAGLGTFEDDGFRLRQYFLADVGREAAMLQALRTDLARFEGVVTYNGRSFDMPMLAGRLAMIRLEPPALSHIDLLHPVRRLFGHRMPGCTLGEAERRLLRTERWDDVPGRQIPGLYFEYARAGRVEQLRPVFRHNAEDVMSLVAVLAEVGRLVNGEALDPEDAAASARWWEAAGDCARARALYEPALPWLVGTDDWAWAAYRHARLCKRAGLRAQAEALWRELWAGGDRRAALELAKHLEHRARDFAGAERIALALLAGAPAAEEALLRHRLERLRRKAARACSWHVASPSRGTARRLARRSG
jgi:uncharacterized protein YprB with RNaseH-like and TPR domain